MPRHRQVPVFDLLGGYRRQLAPPPTLHTSPGRTWTLYVPDMAISTLFINCLVYFLGIFQEKVCRDAH